MALRLLLVSHTYAAPINHAKLQALAAHCDLTVVAPQTWRDALFTLTPPSTGRGYRLITLPVAFNGRLFHHLYAPWALHAVLTSARPQVVYVEEEPHSLALAELAALQMGHGYRLVGFTWENIHQFYGVPGVHRFSLARCAGFVAGNQAAVTVLRQKGFAGPVQVTPQLGLDPDTFRPERHPARRAELNLTGFTVGYVGRLVAEKGLWNLVHAVAALPALTLVLVGSGPLRAALHAWAEANGLAPRLRWVEAVPHDHIPAYLNALDALVLPSLDAPRWQEQFGHILIEAMACGVPVIGSNSGAIPEVIGSAGLVFPQGDTPALQAALHRLHTDPAWHAHLSAAGRARVLAHYTHDQIARANLDFFHTLLS